jgi:hypothetical protein
MSTISDLRRRPADVLLPTTNIGPIDVQYLKEMASRHIEKSHILSSGYRLGLCYSENSQRITTVPQGPQPKIQITNISNPPHLPPYWQHQ